MTANQFCDRSPLLLKESPYTMKAINEKSLRCFAHLRQNGQVYRD